MTKKTQDAPAMAAPLLSLEQLAAELPKPDESAIAALTEDANARAALIAIGRKISTSKIVVDEQRVYNAAYQFFIGATSAQKKTLVGFTLGLLALAVDQALKDQAMAAKVARKKQHTDVETSGATVEAAEAHASAAALRDQGVGVLKHVAVHDRKVLARIDAAHANADVATALNELASVGHDVLADKKSSMAKRASLFGLTTEFLSELGAAAKTVQTVDVAHVGRAPGADQTALDLEDGVNLHLLSAILSAFENAHDRDATIPRLVAIATRRLLGAHSHGKRDDAPPVATPPAVTTPPPATPPTA